MNDILDQINVDIILPNYNSSQYVEETLNSIISQSFKNWNLLIVDDNSDDKTKNILKEISSVKKHGGRVAYSNDITFSSSNLINNYFDYYDSNQKKFLNSISRKYNFEFIFNKNKNSIIRNLLIYHKLHIII